MRRFVVHPLNNSKVRFGLEFLPVVTLLFGDVVVVCMSLQVLLSENLRFWFWAEMDFEFFIASLDAQSGHLAFADFIEHGNLRPAQMNFLETIMRHYIQNGVVDTAMLPEAPFTGIHDQDVFGVFGEDAVMQLISLIDHVNANA